MLAVIQARMGSARLPGKVLMDLGGRSVLAWVVRAAQAAEGLDGVVVATSRDPSDDPVVQMAAACDADVVRGDLEDVLSRFTEVLDTFGDQPVVRLTADCPLLDPALISIAVRTFPPRGLDYVSTVLQRSLPRGLDVEVIGPDALRTAASEATGADRAHVTSYVWRQPARFSVAGLFFAPDASDLRVTLDEAADYQLLRSVVAELGDGPHAWRDVVGLLRARKDIRELNAAVAQKAIELG